MNATDYETLRTGAGLLAWDAWGVVEVSGADRAAFLHNLLSNDIKALAPGRSCRAALLTPNGKLIAELAVLAEGERHWLLAPRACLPALLSTLDRYLITEHVALSDQTTAWTLVAVQGPKAIEIVRAVPDPKTAGYSVTGEPGVLVMAAVDETARVREALVSAGARPVAWEAVHVRRIEAGTPWWGADMDETALLPETGLERELASFTKGCYVGQEIVARMETYGSASRKLVRLTCDGAETPEAGDQITKDGEAIGSITSAAFSPSLNRPAALGYVKRPFYQMPPHTATPVTVVHHGRPVSAAAVPR